MTKVVAELIMTNRAGQTTMVQVFDDVSFSNFYRWSHEAGKISRASNRNNATSGTMTLEEIPAYLDKHVFNPELKIDDRFKVNYYDHAKYQELIRCTPDQLPGGITVDHESHIPTFGEHCLRTGAPAVYRVTDEYRKTQERRAAMFGWESK